MAPRSKQTVHLETLKELGKVTLKEPSATFYLNEDIVVVVSTHQEFLVAVAPHTKRLNPTSVAMVGKELFKMGKREAQLYGDSLAQAYGHCMTAGGKAVTGQKLGKEVLAVYQASSGSDGKELGALKREALKREVKEETASPPRPSKSLKQCLSSPSQIASLYAGSSSSSYVKVMHFVWTKHMKTPRRHRKNASLIFVPVYTLRRHSKMPP